MILLKLFSDFALSLAPALANHLWQSTVVAAIAALLTLAFRKDHARIRYGIWLAASLKFLVPFALLSSLGSHLPQRHTTMVQPAVYSAVQSAGNPVQLPAVTSVQAKESLEKISILPHVIAPVWFCGCAALLFLWIARWRRIRLLLRASTALMSGRVVELLRRMEARAGIRSPLPVFLSETAMEPGIFGVRKPVLLWPAGIATHLEDSHIESILAHELCHVRRYDNLAAVLHMFVETIFWFHPMVWWIGTRLVEERERACDEEVLIAGSDPHTYAESILKICAHCIGSPLTCVSGITGADLKKRVAQIMDSHRSMQLTVAKKALLCASLFATIATPVAYGLAHLTSLRAQLLHADGVLPTFDLATIKPSRADAKGDGISLDPGRFRTRNTSAKGLIQFAFSVSNDSQMGDLPSWTKQEHFDIETRNDEKEVAELKKLPPDLMIRQQRLRLQSLLAQRFNLKVHFESRKLPVLALTIAKGSQPKLAEVPPSALPTDSSFTMKPTEGVRYTTIHGNNGQMESTAVSMSLFAGWIARQDEAHSRLVVDQTGLTGKYDFKLHYLPEGATPEQSANSSEPAFSTALREQLGFQLIPATADVEVLVVDHIDHPTEN